MSQALQKEKRVLARGNEALARAALEAGCRFYAAYPITPQNEIPEYMSKWMPSVNGVFLQAESELSAINMVFGASAAGVRAMTTSSSPGVSLMQEALSFLAGAELPVVIANMQRGGPGLGNISGSQADYFQAVKGGGHGDYKVLVYAPYSVQELWDLTMRAFDKADQYRNPVMILGDGVLGQMMEPLCETPYTTPAGLPSKDWALTGCAGRKPNVVKSLYMGDGVLEKRNLALQEKYAEMEEHEKLWQGYAIEDAELVVAAFGIAARIAYSAVVSLRAEGHKVGLFRPVSLFPFPWEEVARLAGMGTGLFVFELNAGQMVEDIKLAAYRNAGSGAKVFSYGRPGGASVSPEELCLEIKKVLGKGR